VPLLENQLRAALRNNVNVTALLARACRQASVPHFLLVSTDKAIEPASVLGASKRLAELACLAILEDSLTHLAIVRFGNVLGSVGSVVPLFREQIANGGPVTVTHPDISRYFMTIPRRRSSSCRPASWAPNTPRCSRSTWACRWPSATSPSR
jgi:FlaA1/EpsC-like NDP-sugar epimerase